jgi:2-C-methyl-D-erythritol 2,4-cyclodiphosphate synthase
MRIGQGVDVHAFAEERPLILGGVRISERGGLAGHSDADAVLHAIVDAILGAAGLGDIGQYFPSEDERWRDADSELFVRETLRLYGGKVANVDVTIIAQRPKLGPFREPMRDNIARLLDVDASRVNVKATTTDHLGFLGRGEGICAMVVVLLSA